MLIITTILSMCLMVSTRPLRTTDDTTVALTGNRLDEAMSYLRTFGYLSTINVDDPFKVNEAVRAFQQVVGIISNGVLDSTTLDAMRQPRCGNQDIVRTSTSTTTVTSDVDDNNIISRAIRRRRFAQVSRWQGKDDNDVLRLKWYISEYTTDMPRIDIRNVVRRAFSLWSRQTDIPSLRSVRLQFEEATSLTDADINIMWAEGDHGDQYKFDAGGNITNILAHTFYPNYHEMGTLNGDIHFDDYEKWILDGSTSTGTHFPYVLVHEIGHALGLGHSKRQEAVMNPIYKRDALDAIQLDLDDKCAINWNYIGPTNMCLFVWLMAEILPRAGDSVTTSPGASTGSNNLIESSQTFGGKTLDEKMNATLLSLREMDIPVCSDTNDVQIKYELLLEQKLDFPRDIARQYSAVACNFFDGLAEQLIAITDSSSSDEDDERSSDVHLISAHKWQQSNARGFERLVRRSWRRLGESLDDETNIINGDRRHHRRRRRLHRSVFDRNYFDNHFYRRFFHRYLSD